MELQLFHETKPHALCAGMHSKIGDICLGIFKQWRTLYRSNISNGDIIDMHENLYHKKKNNKKKSVNKLKQELRNLKKNCLMGCT